jgi:hypothetical protein
VVDPFWGGGKEELTERMSSTARCRQPEGNGGGAASGGGGRRLGVQGGCTRWRGAQGVVETVGERLERAVRGGSAAARVVVQWGPKVEEEERVLHGGGWAPFIAARRSGLRTARRRNRGQRNNGGKPWARQVNGGRGLEWSERSERGRSMVQT